MEEVVTKNRGPKKFLPNYDPNELEGILVKAREGDPKAIEEILLRFEKTIEGFYSLFRKGSYNYRSKGQMYFLKLHTKDKKKYKAQCMVYKNQLADVPDIELYQMIKVSVLIAIKEWDSNFFLTIAARLKAVVKSYVDDKYRKNEVNIDDVFYVADIKSTEEVLMEELESSIEIPHSNWGLKVLRHEYFSKIGL